MALAALFASCLCHAQPGAVPIPNQLLHLRFIILNVASLDHDPAMVKDYEDALVKQFGLSAAESAVIHSAGQTLKPLLSQNRQAALAIVAGKTALSVPDTAALQALEVQREQAILNLANQILNSVTPATAARLRAAGNILAAHTGTNASGQATGPVN